ncbi:hypothetical protein BC826DRAFT_1191647 [Russula brevipes]|nr:hypothetical protein BC826DRAFT_1191647 [Russula brevipes]
MPSLFSRSRTTTSSLKPQRPSTEHSDEFGRVSSRNSALAVPAPRGTPATVPAKKDKNALEKTRSRTLSAAKGRAPGPLLSDEEPVIPDGSFFPLNLDPPSGDPATSSSDSERGGHRGREQDYGYLSCHHHIVLGLEEVDRLVHTVTEELGTRGLTTPFLFSSLALDVNSSGVRRLVQAFLRTCVSFPAPDAEHTWREEARFAAPAELAMCLRWGLARVLRVSDGNAVRGFISWEMYVEWSEAEVVLDYPTTHFEALVAPLQQSLQSIIINVLSLLARLTAHSSSSGHTPPTSLLFSALSSSALALPPYLSIILISNISVPPMLWSTSFSRFAASLGVPTRLKDWIRGYPAMLPEPSTDQESREAPTASWRRTVRVVSVRRNVRMYTPDLVKSAASWATRAPSGVTHALESVCSISRLGASCASHAQVAAALCGQFQEAHGLPPISIQIRVLVIKCVDRLPLRYHSGRQPDGLLWPVEACNRGEERFRSLDRICPLVPSGETPTLTWTDFSSSGFTRRMRRSARRSNSAPSREFISSGRSNKPTLPRCHRRAFIDVFCDLVYGGMDGHWREEVDRECNWALIEFKALPLARSTITAGVDPRTSSTVFLFEEFVPLEYRQQLSAGVQNKRTLGSFFSPGRTKQGKQAATLDGRPYALGHVP